MTNEPHPELQGTLATEAWRRPLGVLTSPQATFRSIAERPSWLPPLLVLLILYVALQVVVTQRIDMEGVMRQAFEERNQPIDEEQIARMAQMQSNFGVACQVVVFPLGMMLIAAFLLGLTQLAGGEIDFRRSLAVTGHGLMPNAVAWLLTLPVVLGRREIDLVEAQGGLLASHLALFAADDTPAWLLTLLARLDLFSLWSLVLLGVGAHVVGGLSSRASAIVVAVLWLLWVGLMVGLTAAGWAGGT